MDLSICLRRTFFLLMSATLVACSSSGGSDSSTSGFQITGTLSSLTPSTSLSKAAAGSQTITNVVAVSPETEAASCKVVEVDSSGRFLVYVTGEKPWYVYFIDDSKTGDEMYVAHIKTSALDTLPPNATEGELNLQIVTANAETGEATSSVDDSTVISGLGLDSGTVDVIGDVDEVATRYSNPDVDGDGEIDCPTRETIDTATDTAGSGSYMMDFHVRFDVKVSGADATVDNIIDQYFNTTTTTTSYSTTGVYVAYLNTYSSLDEGSVTFVDSSVTTTEGGVIPANTPTSDVTANNFGDYLGFGVNVANTSELPTGKIVFTVDGNDLTFSEVSTPRLAKLNNPTGWIFPWIKLTKTDSSCTTGCTIASMGYKWMKKGESGWSTASLAELNLLVDADGGTFSFRIDADENKYIAVTIPKPATEDDIEGTVAWTAENATLPSGVTSSEFEGMYTTQICGVGLSYDDTVGMRYFENIQNVDGTCGG